ncbi:MAG: hypothetical protein DWQ42_19220 [Planctomycetota bacterium]|nr:MAG: hypothetical protein DWQ42_19220 [Planctomycetota bacterium]
MSKAQVSLRLITDSRQYQPGETLAGEYFVDVMNPNDIRAVEVSVLWFTEGKGDEDLAVHFFQRQTNDDEHYVDLRATQHFTTVLPNSPLSYDGVLVRVRWCVRVRAFLPRGRELVAEEGFRLGEVPSARVVDEGRDTGDELDEVDMAEEQIADG